MGRLGQQEAGPFSFWPKAASFGPSKHKVPQGVVALGSFPASSAHACVVRMDVKDAVAPGTPAVVASIRDTQAHPEFSHKRGRLHTVWTDGYGCKECPSPNTGFRLEGGFAKDAGLLQLFVPTGIVQFHG